MKRLMLVLLAIALWIPIGMVNAQEPLPGTKEDNACNPGGSMAGKCETPWHWVCGYYLARWEAAGGWNTQGNVLNDACVSLLPTAPEASGSGIITTCHTVFPFGTLCVSSDGTGYNINNGTVLLYRLVVGPVPASCPSVLGYTYLSSGNAVPFFTAYQFTLAELSVVGWTTNFCIYF